jgi:hypothetical protein
MQSIHIIKKNTSRAWKSTRCATIKWKPCKTKIILVILSCLTISQSCYLQATFFCLCGTVVHLHICPDTGILTANSLKLRPCVCVLWTPLIFIQTLSASTVVLYFLLFFSVYLRLGVDSRVIWLLASQRKTENNDRTQKAQNRAKWQAFVNIVLNLTVP